MKLWQKVVIALIAALFFVSNWKVFKENGVREWDAKEVSMIFDESQTIHRRAVKAIEEGSYTPRQYADDMYQLLVLKTSTAVHYQRALEGIQESLGKKYLPAILADPRVAAEVTEEMSRVFEPIRTEALANTKNGLKWLYWEFLPFSLLIILVRRWSVKGLYLGSFGDTISVLLATFLWPIGVFVYKPINSFQRRVDYQVKVWKERIGEKGLRLGLAYVVAVVIALFSTLRPIVVRAQVVKSEQITTVVPSKSLPDSNAVVAIPTISGFGQVKFDELGFTIPKVRISLKGPVETGLLKVRYETYIDFGSSGAAELGYASLVLEFLKQGIPEVVIGRTLDPITYQFPPPFARPILYYPSAALFNPPNDVGVFLRNNGNLWWMVGLANGNGMFRDDNKSLDFTSRVTRKIPFGFEVGLGVRGGSQQDGYRKLSGFDFTWQHRPMWLNGGQNVMDYNGRQIGRWLWGTWDVTSFQLVGLIESLNSNGSTTTGWAVGTNISLTPKTVIRADIFKKAQDSSNGWGILFQQRF